MTLKGLYLVLDALVLGDHGGFAVVLNLFIAIFVLAVARGFKKRKGWAFLAVSVSLLVGWMWYLILAIFEFDHHGWEGASTSVYLFILSNVLIGYLGRRSMETRFRPHLAH